MKAPGDDVESGDDHEGGDIEASIRKELGSLNSAASSGEEQKRVFTPVRMHVDCILFTKTQPPVEPVEFVNRICQDAKAASSGKTRYVNRLTPITRSGWANEKGVDEIARAVLAKWFVLADDTSAGEKALPAYSVSAPLILTMLVPWWCRRLTPQYAIRPSIRNHATLSRDSVIKQIAALVDSRHKVKLEAPDKVIIVDIFKVGNRADCEEHAPPLLTRWQTVCGMSVVDGDWDSLKRYNLTELYACNSQSAAAN